MINGIFFEGSGLGDQLHRYVTIRTLAEEKGFEFGMIDPHYFKGKSFMSPYMGIAVPTGEAMYYPDFVEKKVTEDGVDVRSYDPEINFVKDWTILDGCFEDEKYWGHNLDNIREWLKVEPIEIADDLCVIGFRGGEYYTDPNLGLPKSYYDEATALMCSKYPGIRFEVHTDDPILAKQFFPDYECIQDIGLNWRSVRYAKHLIIANSAFFILPSLLGPSQEVIAPRYWARRNIKKWARPACYYKDKRFMYI